MVSTRACLCFVLLAACLYGVSSLEWESRSSATTIPVIMWSDKQIFASPNTQVVDTISSSDVEFVLASLFKTASDSKDSKLASYLEINKETTPEVVVLFVEPQLSTDKVPIIASAYASTTGGSFSNLKDIVAAAGSSLVIPYATAGWSLLDDPLSNLFDSIKEGSIFMSRLTGSELFVVQGRQSGVKTVDIDSLIPELKSANAFANGVTDLVVVCFDKPAYGKQAIFASHDEIIGSITESVSKATKGNYVAMYSANMPSPSYLIWTFEQHSEAEFHHNLRMSLLGNATNNNSNNSNITTTGINYFPGPLIEVYLIVSIMLAMAFTGGCAIFSLQTPDRWEAPTVKRQQF